MAKTLIYGVADEAWQVVLGCNNERPCWERCWAKRTVRRLMDSPHPKVAEAHANLVCRATDSWTGIVRLNEAHLTDPLGWRPAVIAMGFHGEWALLNDAALGQIFNVVRLANRHRVIHLYLTLTKRPDLLARYFERNNSPGNPPRFPIGNVNLGVSITNQTDANSLREPMRQLADFGWKTHVWYSPAIGQVDWSGWEFITGMVCEGESGPDARPMDPLWARNARDWCIAHGIPFTFKQWGDYLPAGQTGGTVNGIQFTAPGPHPLRAVKKATGRLLDGREWNEFPPRI